MVRSAEEMNAFSILSLVASDFSYKPSDAIRELPNPNADTLKSFPDNAQADERSFPVDLVRGLSNSIDSLLHRNITQGDPTVGTFTTIEFDNWVVQKKFNVPGSGFGAVVFRSLSTHPIDRKYEYIVAFRGTRGPDAINWYDNLDLGAETWKKDGQQVIDYLRGVTDSAGNPGLDQETLGDIFFTGQSLGGGLAQYGAYEYARQQGQAFDASRITLITFNGFGGVRGLQLMNGGYNPNLIKPVDTRHYVIDNDIVHRLGAGDRSQLAAVGGSWHVNGTGNTYQFDFLQRRNGQVVLASDGRQLKLFLVDAHRIESGFYDGFATQEGSEPKYLDTGLRS